MAHFEAGGGVHTNYRNETGRRFRDPVAGIGCAVRLYNQADASLLAHSNRFGWEPSIRSIEKVDLFRIRTLKGLAAAAKLLIQRHSPSTLPHNEPAHAVLRRSGVRSLHPHDLNQGEEGRSDIDLAQLLICRKINRVAVALRVKANRYRPVTSWKLAPSEISSKRPRGSRHLVLVAKLNISQGCSVQPA